jgi:hypothetical protein
VGLARLTRLQVLHHLGDMVILMVAAPAGIGEVSPVHAEHEPGLFLCGFLRWPHVFPFRNEDRSARVCRLACGDGCCSPHARRVPWPVFRPPEETGGLKKPARAESARGGT